MNILPLQDLNPHGIDTKPEAYARWWNEHPDVDPIAQEQGHERTLELIYVGARISFIAGQHLNRVPLRLGDQGKREMHS